MSDAVLYFNEAAQWASILFVFWCVRGTLPLLNHLGGREVRRLKKEIEGANDE